MRLRGVALNASGVVLSCVRDSRVRGFFNPEIVLMAKEGAVVSISDQLNTAVARVEQLKGELRRAMQEERKLRAALGAAK